MRSFLIIVLIVVSGIAKAQNYPVQAFLQVTPPYSGYLPDYSDPFNQQMKVLLTLNDFSVPSYNVKLQFSFNGNGYSLQNPDYLASPTYTLYPGVPLEISGADLAHYLSLSNLQVSGLNVQDYQNRKILPEGPLTVCVKILDANLPVATNLANPACNQIWVSLYDPPLLNTPMCGQEVTVLNPQFMTFTWMPLHMNAPGASTNTEYTFELFEIRPDGNDPNIVVNQTLPIYTTTTTQTVLTYGITEPPLQENMSYVWRVKASDLNGRDHFNNQGYSQVCTFTYGNMAANTLAGISLNLSAHATGNRQGHASWTSNNVFTNYTLEVRKTGNPNYAWFPHNTTGASFGIHGLEPETEYECRVRGEAQGEYSDWSNTAVFTTHATPEYSCGSTTMPPTDPNAAPLLSAQPYQVYQIGQFELMVTSISPSQTHPGSGWYQGTGKVSIPFALTSLNVSFDAIYVDEHLMVVNGELHAITDGVQNWIQEQSMIDPLEYTVPGIIESAGVNNDSMAYVVVDGDTITFPFPNPYDPIIVNDDSDYEYVIFPDGTVIIRLAHEASDDTLAATERWHVDFFKSDAQVYGFDSMQYNVWSEHYEHIFNDSFIYHVPWKSLARGAGDIVKARFIDLDNVDCPISFETAAGNSIQASQSGEDYTLQLPAVENDFAIYALCNGERIGKLNVAVYKGREKNIHIVPLAANLSIDTSTVRDAITSIYNQGAGKISLYLEDPFTDQSWDLNADNKLAAGNHSNLVDYSAEMRALNQAYLAHNTALKASDYIVFIIPSFDENNVDVGGYMPMGRHKGYVQSQSTPAQTAHVLAHEIGHGCYGLEHTFPEVSQGETGNLMDYGNEHHLTKMQWDEMDRLLPDFNLFDDEEDGEYAVVDGSSLPANWKNADGSYTFLSLSGKPITLSGNIGCVKFATWEEEAWQYDGDYTGIPVEHLQFSTGPLAGFVVDGVEYSAGCGAGVATYNDTSLIGYDCHETTGYINLRNDSLFYIDSLTSQNNYPYVISGVPCIIGNELGFTMYRHDFNDVLSAFGLSGSASIAHYNKADGPIVTNLENSLFGEYEYYDEAAILADFTEGFSPEELAFLTKEFGSEICGIDALMAFNTIALLRNNLDLWDCILTAHGVSVSQVSSWATASVNEQFASTNDENEFGIVPIPVDAFRDFNPGGVYTTVQSNQDLFRKNTYEIEYEAIYNSNYIEFFYNNMNHMDGVLNRELAGTENGAHHAENSVSLIAFFSRLNPDDLKCLLSALSMNARKAYLKAFMTDNDNGEIAEDLICQLILTTPPSDYSELLSFMGQTFEGERIIFHLFDDLDDVSKYLDQTIYFLSSIQLALSPPDYENTFPITEIDPNSPMSYFMDGRFFGDDFEFTQGRENAPYFYVGKGVFEADNQSIVFEVDYDEYSVTLRNKSTLPLYQSVLREYVKHPFSYVAVRFKDNYVFSDFSGEQIELGTDMVVPMIWLVWLDQRQGEIESAAAFRAFINFVAVGVSIATMEPGPLLLVEIAFAATDTYFALNADAIRSSNNQNDIAFLDAYESFAETFGVVTLAGVGAQAIKSVAINYAEIVTKIKSLATNPAEILAIKKVCTDLIDAVPKLGANLISNSSELLFLAKKTLIEIELHIASTLKHHYSRIVQGRIWTLDGFSNSNLGLAGVDYAGQPYLYDINWGGLGSTNVVEELNNVRIKINDNVVAKDLQIVETPLGNGLSSLKVRLSPADPEAFSMMLLDDAIDLSSESIKQITANKLNLIEGAGQNGEQFFDVVVHGDGKDYFINGVEISGGDNLAQLLQTHNQSNQAVRLLSCSSLESAKEISSYIGVDVIANNGLTRIHDDGGITAVSKNGTGNEDWYRLSPDGTQVKVNAPDPGNMPGSFVTLGGGAQGVGAFGKYSTKFDEFVEVLQKETLYGDDALTFLDAEYRTVKTTTSVTGYRAFGGNAKVGGTFVTTTKGATRNELAVLDDWNSMRFEAKIEIPPQTKLNIGKVGPQSSDDGLQVLTGGGDQVILPFQWNTQWVKEIKDLNTGTIYNSVEEFKIDFPHLVD